MKKVIRLTESDLHRIVNESVQRILTEEMDEGLFGGLGALGQMFGNKARKAGQGMTNAASQKIGQAKDAMGRVANAVGNKVNQAGRYVSNKANQAGQYVGNAYNNAKETVGNAYNDAKQTYQTGSASSDAQSAIQDAVKALQNLKAADQKLQSMGQYSVIGKQGVLIDQLLKVLGSTSGRFKARTSAFANS